MLSTSRSGGKISQHLGRRSGAWERAGWVFLSEHRRESRLAARFLRIVRRKCAPRGAAHGVDAPLEDECPGSRGGEKSCVFGALLPAANPFLCSRRGELYLQQGELSRTMMEGAPAPLGPYSMHSHHHLLPQTPANHASSGFLNPETPAAPDSSMAPPVPNPTPCSAVRAAPVGPHMNTAAMQSHPAKASASLPPPSSTKAFAPPSDKVVRCLHGFGYIFRHRSCSPCTDVQFSPTPVPRSAD